MHGQEQFAATVWFGYQWPWQSFRHVNFQNCYLLYLNIPGAAGAFVVEVVEAEALDGLFPVKLTATTATDPVDWMGFPVPDFR